MVFYFLIVLGKGNKELCLIVKVIRIKLVDFFKYFFGSIIFIKYWRVNFLCYYCL